MKRRTLLSGGVAGGFLGLSKLLGSVAPEGEPKVTTEITHMQPVSKTVLPAVLTNVTPPSIDRAQMIIPNRRWGGMYGSSTAGPYLYPPMAALWYTDFEHQHLLMHTKPFQKNYRFAESTTHTHSMFMGVDDSLNEEE